MKQFVHQEIIDHNYIKVNLKCKHVMPNSYFLLLKYVYSCINQITDYIRQAILIFVMVSKVYLFYIFCLSIIGAKKTFRHHKYVFFLSHLQYMFNCWHQPKWWKMTLFCPMAVKYFLSFKTGQKVPKSLD